MASQEMISGFNSLFCFNIAIAFFPLSKNKSFKLFTSQEYKYNMPHFGIRISSIEVSRQAKDIHYCFALSTTKLIAFHPGTHPFSRVKRL